MRLARAPTRPGSSARSTAGRTVRCQASWSCSSSSDGGSAGGLGRRLPACSLGRCRLGDCRLGAGAAGRAARCSSCSSAEGERLAREVRAGPRHLDERELERQARVAALAHVVDGDGEQVAEPQHGRLAELVRLRAQPLARLLGDRQRLGHLAHVLDEHQVAQVLEQVGDEPAEILALLRELLDERRARRPCRGRRRGRRGGRAPPPRPRRAAAARPAR